MHRDFEMNGRGLPLCKTSCPQWDGKTRMCTLLQRTPNVYCEPELEETAKQVESMRKSMVAVFPYLPHPDDTTDVDAARALRRFSRLMANIPERERGMTDPPP